MRYEDKRDWTIAIIVGVLAVLNLLVMFGVIYGR